MKRFTKIASLFALSLFVLALPSIASAQWRDRNGNDDDYYGRNDDRYNRNGNYNNRNIRGTVMSLRNRARNFERRLDRVDDRRNDNWGRRGNQVDDLQRLADRFVNATDDLANSFGRGRDMGNSRDEARRVLDIGGQIENILYRSRNAGYASNDWSQISNDLRTIASAYGLNYNRNRSGGNWRNNVPFPLPF